MSRATKDRTGQERIGDWIDEAGAAMGGDASSRQDAKRELTSTIYDKVEERTGAGECEQGAIVAVLDELGDARQMGHAFLPQRPLIAPERTRAFLLATAALFAVHAVLVIGATIASMPLGVPMLHIRPLSNTGFLSFAARSIQILLFDGGLMLALFLVRARVGRIGNLPRVSGGSDRDPRRRFQSAAFLVLVLVVVNFLRDNLFALYIPQGDGTLQVPILGSGFTDNVLLFNAWLILAAVREIAHAVRGASASMRLLDITARVFGIFCLLRLVATRKIVDLSAARDTLGTDADTLGSLLNSAFTLIALAAAALLALATVKRTD